MNIRPSTVDAFADMWRSARKDSGKSQDYVAKALGISRRTVESWENGEGCPNQRQGFEFFHVIGRSPLPYYYRVIFPVQFHNLLNDPSDENVKAALMKVIENMSPEEHRKLLYCISGSHGRSTRSILELAVAYLQLPLANVISIASHIVINYRLCHCMRTLRPDEGTIPNIDLIDHAIRNATQSVKDGKEDYLNINF